MIAKICTQNGNPKKLHMTNASGFFQDILLQNSAIMKCVLSKLLFLSKWIFLHESDVQREKLLLLSEY